MEPLEFAQDVIKIVIKHGVEDFKKRLESRRLQPVDAALALAGEYYKQHHAAASPQQLVNLGRRQGPVAVVFGDVHGEAHSLAAAIRHHANALGNNRLEAALSPEGQQQEDADTSPQQADPLALFMGDYFDRGDDNFITAVILFSSLLVFPCSVVAFQGNHEQLLRVASKLEQYQGTTMVDSLAAAARVADTTAESVTQLVVEMMKDNGNGQVPHALILDTLRRHRSGDWEGTRAEARFQGFTAVVFGALSLLPVVGVCPQLSSLLLHGCVPGQDVLPKGCGPYSYVRGFAARRFALVVWGPDKPAVQGADPGAINFTTGGWTLQPVHFFPAVCFLQLQQHLQQSTTLVFELATGVDHALDKLTAALRGGGAPPANKASELAGVVGLLHALVWRDRPRKGFGAAAGRSIKSARTPATAEEVADALEADSEALGFIVHTTIRGHQKAKGGVLIAPYSAKAPPAVPRNYKIITVHTTVTAGGGKHPEAGMLEVTYLQPAPAADASDKVEGEDITAGFSCEAKVLPTLDEHLVGAAVALARAAGLGVIPDGEAPADGDILLPFNRAAAITTLLKLSTPWADPQLPPASRLLLAGGALLLAAWPRALPLSSNLAASDAEDLLSKAVPAVVRELVLTYGEEEGIAQAGAAYERLPQAVEGAFVQALVHGLPERQWSEAPPSFATPKVRTLVLLAALCNASQEAAKASTGDEARAWRAAEGHARRVFLARRAQLPATEQPAAAAQAGGQAPEQEGAAAASSGGAVVVGSAAGGPVDDSASRAWVKACTRMTAGPCGQDVAVASLVARGHARWRHAVPANLLLPPKRLALKKLASGSAAPALAGTGADPPTEVLASGGDGAPGLEDELPTAVPSAPAAAPRAARPKFKVPIPGRKRPAGSQPTGSGAASSPGGSAGGGDEMDLSQAGGAAAEDTFRADGFCVLLSSGAAQAPAAGGWASAGTVDEPPPGCRLEEGGSDSAQPRLPKRRRTVILNEEEDEQEEEAGAAAASKAPLAGNEVVAPCASTGAGAGSNSSYPESVEPAAVAITEAAAEATEVAAPKPEEGADADDELLQLYAADTEPHQEQQPQPQALQPSQPPQPPQPPPLPVEPLPAEMKARWQEQQPQQYSAFTSALVAASAAVEADCSYAEAPGLLQAVHMRHRNCFGTWAQVKVFTITFTARRGASARRFVYRHFLDADDTFVVLPADADAATLALTNGPVAEKGARRRVVLIAKENGTATIYRVVVTSATADGQEVSGEALGTSVEKALGDAVFRLVAPLEDELLAQCPLYKAYAQEYATLPRLAGTATQLAGPLSKLAGLAGPKPQRQQMVEDQEEGQQQAAGPLREVEEQPAVGPGPGGQQQLLPPIPEVEEEKKEDGAAGPMEIDP